VTTATRPRPHELGRRGWPCLRFNNAKMGAEQLLPLSPQGVEAIRSQQRLIADTWPQGSSWRLFPSRFDPNQPLPYATLHLALAEWVKHRLSRDVPVMPRWAVSSLLREMIVVARSA
jgi:hypothetical protein